MNQLNNFYDGIGQDDVYDQQAKSRAEIHAFLYNSGIPPNHCYLWLEGAFQDPKRFEQPNKKQKN